MTIRILFAIICVAASTDARADAEALALFEEGQRLYHAGKYVEAGDRFAAAYKREPDPAYIYNAAQAYRAGNACARAAAAYRTFATAVPNAPEPDKLQRHIEEMDACASEQQLAPPPPDLDIAPRAPPPSTPPAITPRPPAPPTVEPTQDTGRMKRRLGIGLGVAGVALVGTAVWFSLDARSLARDYDAHCKDATQADPCDGAKLADYDRRGRRAETLAIAGYIVGGAALATGVTLYFFGREQRAESTLSLRPTRDGAMVTRAWSF